MGTEKKIDQLARSATDELEIEEFVGRVDATSHDQYAHYTHELPEESADATSRALVRVVPLAYGGLLGALADNVTLGLFAGFALSAAFDLYMDDNSMVRALSRRMFTKACPAIAVVVRALGALIGRVGLPAPAALNEMRCGVSQP